MGPKPPPLCSIIQGPLPKPCPSLQLSFFWKNENWNFESLPFDIPNTIGFGIKNSFLPKYQSQYETPLWLPRAMESFLAKLPTTTYSIIGNTQVIGTLISVGFGSFKFLMKSSSFFGSFTVKTFPLILLWPTGV